MNSVGQLCFCNSGKKLSECCFSKNNITIERHWCAIKSRITYEFIFTHQTKGEFEKLIVPWLGESRMAALSKSKSDLPLFEMVTDAYYFTANKREWGFFLMKKMKEIVQPKSHIMLSKWKEPVFFIGQIIDFIHDFVIVKDVMNDEIVYIQNLEVDESKLHSIIVCQLLSGANPNFYTKLNTALFIDAKDLDFLEAIKQLIDQSNQTTMQDFYEQHILDCLDIILPNGESIVESEACNQIEHTESIIQLEYELNRMGVNNEDLIIVFEKYLIEVENVQRVRTRKKQALIAGIIDFAIKYDFIPKMMTKKKLGEFYEISTSTITRKSQKISLYFEEVFDFSLIEQMRQSKKRIGTDATQEEFTKWQVKKQMEKLVFTNELDRKRMEKAVQEIPYNPQKKQLKAQKYAYEAYCARNQKRRWDLAALALSKDPKNIDAQIILSENQEIPERIQLLNNLECSDYSERTVLLKITLYFQIGAYEEALKTIELLPESLLQKTKILHYFKTVLYVLFKKISTEQEIHDYLPNKLNPMEAWLCYSVAHYLKWQSEDRFEAEANSLNRFVPFYLKMGKAPFGFPTNSYFENGDLNEAKIIYFLISPLF